MLSFLPSLLLGGAPRRSQTPRKPLRASADEALADAVAWIVAHGGCYADPERLELYGHAPFALEPFPFPKREYDRLVALQPHFNALVDAVARDAAWLDETLAPAAKADAFTRRLLELRETCDSPQKASLGLLRSDYMLDAPGGDMEDGSGRALQVELNTIASSFDCLSTVLSGLHAYVAGRYAGAADDGWLLPENGARDGLAAGLAVAHREYERQFPAADDAPPRRVAIVVQPGERNQMDQRMLEHALQDAHGVAMSRVTLLDVAGARAALDEHSRALAFDGGAWEASVIYFRAGYSPAEYLSEAEWTARAALENSRAIKCPTVAYQLAGTKKVQQALAAPGVVERFASSSKVADELRTVFAGLYALEPGADGADEMIKAAISNPDRFVLKPQREGGGNNLYGEELKAGLETMSPEELGAYILMDRISPPARDATLVRAGAAIAGQCVCELGVYGAILTGPDGEILHSGVPGHLLRQKTLGVDEGGVAAGFACLSSPALVPKAGPGASSTCFS